MDLRTARFFNDMSQIDLGLHVGMTQTKISLIERGYCVPRKYEIKKLARALGIRPEELEFIDLREQIDELA